MEDSLSSSSSSSSSSDTGLTSSGLKLDNLHEDIHHFYLFKYLHIKDVLKLKSVNKKLYSIVNSYNIKELFFLDNECDDEGYVYLYQEKCGKVNNILDHSKLDLLTNSTDNLLNLKSLRIYSWFYVDEIEQLNRLTKLQKLEIYNISTDSDSFDNCYANENCSLNLPVLKELVIHLYYDYNLPFKGLTINAPNLQKLDIVNCVFEHPLSIKYLSLCLNYRRLAVFVNLECLQLYVYSGLLDTLHQLPNLKNLKKLKIDCIHSGYLQETISKLKDLFKSKKNGLEFVLYGVKINRLDKLDEYKGGKDLRFQLDNYGDLDDDLDFVNKMNYNELISLLPKLPSDLFSKYQIKQIKIDSSVKDESKLIDFIKKCKKLYALKVRCASLSQRFYDELPSISLLSYLKIVEHKVNINLKFTDKMPHLIRLDTSIEIDDDVSMHEN